MGRMKSLGYAYAEHLGDGVDVDWYFESIVNGEIEIPKWFVEEWLEANPIFASEENDTPVKSARLMKMNIYRTAAPKDEMDDWVVHGTNWYRITTHGPLGTKPESRQVSVDAYGIGSTEQLAREDFSKRAGNYLSIQENDFHHLRNFASEDSEKDVRVKCTSCPNGYIRDIPIQPTTMGKRVMCDTCRAVFFLGRPVYHDVGPQMRFDAEDSEDYEVIMTNIGHSMERDGETIVFGDVVFATPNDGRSRISSYGQGADKASARQALIDRATGYLIEEEFNAETKSWRMQKRDSKGRFTKGFVEEIDIGQFMEMDPEEIPLMPPYTYSPEEVVEFINDCINMDDFPEQLMNSAFLDYLQQVTASADLELLEGLSNAAHTSLIENGIYDDRAGMAAAKRAIFVTDVFLNFKWGQENWAAEDY